MAEEKNIDKIEIALKAFVGNIVTITNGIGIVDFAGTLYKYESNDFFEIVFTEDYRFTFNTRSVVAIKFLSPEDIEIVLSNK